MAFPFSFVSPLNPPPFQPPTAHPPSPPPKKTQQADPDLIRNELPEIGGYIREDPVRAGLQTHREAGWVSFF